MQSINLADLLSKTEVLTQFPEVSNSNFTHMLSSELIMARKLKSKKQNLTFESLDESQKVFVEYALKNKNALILIQSSPGTGKTRTLQVFNVLYKKDLNVVIFKKDLLSSFDNISNIYSNTQFFMKHFKFGKYFTHLNIEKEFGYSMTFIELFFIIIALVKKFNIEGIQDSMFIFDEYTFIPKPILFSLLTIFSHSKIPAIFCGDKHQLQNIQDIKLMKTSSYDISRTFVDKTFKFNINHRCGDTYYNDVIDLLSNLSSDEYLGEIGMALVAIIYPDACIADLSINLLENTFIGPEYKEISKVLYKLINLYKIPCSFYHIYSKNESSNINGRRMGNGLYKCNASIKFEEQGFKNESFLPFMPLIKNAPYFVEEMKNKRILPLIDIEFDNKNGILVPHKLIFKSKNKVLKIGKKSTDVIFSKHKDYLLGINSSGKLYQFDAYYAGCVSYQMCQGRTILNGINMIITEKSTFRGLYVLASRTTNPKNIQKVYLPNYFRYLFSNIMNFPELCQGNKVPVQNIKARFNNYLLYTINTDNTTVRNMISRLVYRFYKSEYEEDRKSIRRDIMKITNNITDHKVLNFKQSDPVLDRNYAILNDHKNLILKLSILDDVEAAAWVYEFFNCPENNILQTVFNGLSNLSGSNNALCKYASLNLLETLVQSTKNFIEFHCIVDHLKIVKEDDGVEKILTNNIVKDCRYYTCIKIDESSKIGLYTTNLLAKIYDKLVKKECFYKQEMLEWLDSAIEENIKSQIDKPFSQNNINKRSHNTTTSQPINQLPMSLSKRFRRN